MVTITETVKISLTEKVVPRVIYAKQYDNMTRLVVCKVYEGSTQTTLDSNATINVSGKRADGEYFQYSSDESSDVAYIEDGSACFWITDAMTSSTGRFVVDVTITADGEVIGTFGLILRVEQAAIQNEGLYTGSYSDFLSSLAGAITDVYIDDDGLLWIETSDELGITMSVDDEGNITIEY